MKKSEKTSFDLFERVLQYSSDCFDLKDYQTFMMVSNHFFKIIYDSADLFILTILSQVLSNGQKSTRYWFKHFVLPKLKGGLSSDMSIIVINMLKATKNLIKNASCSDSMNHWKITKAGGDGWKISRNYPHLLPAKRPKQMAFAGSYGWCEVQQEILFPEDIKDPYFIEAGAYISRRWDCGCKAKIILKIKDEFNNIFFKHFIQYEKELPTGGEFSDKYCYRHAIMRIQSASIKGKPSKITLKISTIDTKYWARYFAARFTDMFVRFVPTKFYNPPPLSDKQSSIYYYTQNI